MILVPQAVQLLTGPAGPLAGLEGAGLAAALAYGVTLALRATATVRALRCAADRGTARPFSGESSGLTVLQPILGGDPALPEVLASTLRNAPAFVRFLWLVDEPDTLGRSAAKVAAGDDPRVTIRVVPPPRDDENPKVAKLALALPDVTTPLVAVLDDDTVASRECFDAACQALSAAGEGNAPRADLYTGLPSYELGVTFADALLAAFVNDSAPFVYLPWQRRLGALSINGMFYVARTHELRTSGAFEVIRAELCDDYALARHLRRLGWRLEQGTRPLRLRTSLTSFAQYRRLLHRWAVFTRVLLRDQPLGLRFLLVASLGLPPAFLGVAVVGAAAGVLRGIAGVPEAWLVPAVVAALFVARHVVLRAVQRCVHAGAAPPRPFVASILAEVLQPLHFVHATLVPTIRWRTRLVRVGTDGRYRSLGGGDA
jgi:ceramide glucosyltransferase